MTVPSPCPLAADGVGLHEARRRRRLQEAALLALRSGEPADLPFFRLFHLMAAPAQFRQRFRPDAALHHDMAGRSEEHTSELQSLMRISSAAFCVKTKIKHVTRHYAVVS